MEILALSSIAGVASLSNVPKIARDRLSLECEVLIAFTEAKNKSYERAYQILQGSIEGLITSYGPRSMEFLLAGTTMLNCCNVIREGEGVKLGHFIIPSFTHLMG
jgi:hypothetical protein